jgi:bacteriorhodopsin
MLIGTSIVQAIAASHATDTKAILSNTTGSVICGIAFVHYTWITRPGCDVMAIRYSDWLLTLPLLLLDIFLICGVDILNNLWICILAGLLLLAMIFAGWRSVRSHRTDPTNHARYAAWISVGFVCLLAVYWIVFGLLEPIVTGADTLSLITLGFFVMWIVYGIVAAFPRHMDVDGHVQQAYDVLDLLTKAVFGLVVAADVFRRSREPIDPEVGV